MRAILLKVWRWQARRIVKAELDNSGNLYIARKDVYDSKWQREGNRFVCNNQAHLKIQMICWQS